MMNLEYFNKVIDTCECGLSDRLMAVHRAVERSQDPTPLLDDVQRYCYFIHYNVQALKRSASILDVSDYLPLEQLLFSILTWTAEALSDQGIDGARLQHECLMKKAQWRTEIANYMQVHDQYQAA
jgi:hypothetical protein